MSTQYDLMLYQKRQTLTITLSNFAFLYFLFSYTIFLIRTEKKMLSSRPICVFFYLFIYFRVFNVPVTNSWGKILGRLDNFGILTSINKLYTNLRSYATFMNFFPSDFSHANKPGLISLLGAWRASTSSLAKCHQNCVWWSQRVSIKIRICATYEQGETTSNFLCQSSQYTHYTKTIFATKINNFSK